MYYYEEPIEYDRAFLNFIVNISETIQEVAKLSVIMFKNILVDVQKFMDEKQYKLVKYSESNVFKTLPKKWSIMHKDQGDKLFYEEAISCTWSACYSKTFKFGWSPIYMKGTGIVNLNHKVCILEDVIGEEHLDLFNDLSYLLRMT